MEAAASAAADADPGEVAANAGATGGTAARDTAGDPAWTPPQRLRDLDRTARLAALVGALLVIAAGVASTWAMWSRGRVLYGDEARLAMESLRSVRTRPLLGVLTTASEYGGRDVRNPGPAQLYALYPFVRLLGTDVGSWAHAAAVTCGSVLAAGWFAFRTGGRRAGAIAALCTVGLLVTSHPAATWQVLNDPLVLAPTFACLFTAWAIAAGDPLALPAFVVVGSFVAQTYVGGSVTVLLAGLAGVLILLGLLRSRGAPPHLTASLLTAVAAAAVMWALPLVDQVTGTGNLGALLRLDVPGGGRSGAVAALQASVDPTSLWWTRWGLQGGLPAASVLGWLWVVVACGALVVLARRSRPGSAVPSLIVVCGAVLVAAAVHGFVIPPTDTATYHFLWVGGTAWSVAATLAIGVADRVPDRVAAGAPASEVRTSPAWAVAGTALLGLALLPLVSGTRPPEVATGREAAVRDISDQLEANLPPGRWATVSLGGFLAADVQRGIEAQLARSGRTLAWGQDRAATLVVTHDTSAADLPGRRLARWTGRPAEFAALADVPDRVAGVVRSAGPPVLTPSGVRRLPNMVDGVVPAACAADLGGEPDRLLELPPGVLAALYAQGDVVSPALPPALQEDVETWFGAAPVSVHRIEPSTTEPYSIDGFLVSDDTC